MKRFIHRGYFLEIFTQLRTAGIVMASVLMLFNAPTLIGNATALFENNLMNVPSAESMALYMMGFIYIASLVLTFIAYNWLNHRSTSDFYHALPIKRSRIYWSTFLAVALWIAIGITGYAIVYLALYLITGMPFNYLTFLCVYLNMLIGIVHVVGVVSLACAISGTRFVNLFASFAILLVPRILLMVLALFVWMNADYLPVTRIFFLFDPSYNIFGTPYMEMVGSFASLLGESHLSVDFCSIPAMLYAAAHACLLAFLGCIAFKRRPSESAGMPMRSRLMQGAIRTAIGLPLLLILVLMLSQEEFYLSVSVLLVLFSFTFYCLYELISTKSAKRMVRAMPLFTICIAIAMLYLFIPKLIALGSESINADESNIASVELTGTGDSVYSRYIGDGDSYLSHCRNKMRVDDPQAIRIIARAYERSVATHKTDLYDTDYLYMVRIHRKNGRALYRNLRLTSTELSKLNEIVAQTDAYIEISASYPKGTQYYSAQSLTLSESREIGRLFKEEYETLSKDDRLRLSGFFEYDYRSEQFSHSFYTLIYNGVYGTNSYSGRFPICDLTPKTAQRYAEILSQKYNEHTTDELRSTMRWMETGIYSKPDQYGTNPYVNYHLSSIRIGNSVILRYPGTFYQNSDGKLLPKSTDPEEYEILKILLDANLTDGAEGVTVCIGDLYNSSYSYGFVYNRSLNSNVVTFNLNLSDEQLAQIITLYEQYAARIESNNLALQLGIDYDF